MSETAGKPRPKPGGEWAPKVFWTEVGVVDAPGGFGITLDGRTVRTPAKAPLCVPTAAAAELVAAEWRAQIAAPSGRVDPASMPHTRTANAAIDKVAVKRAEVAAMLADYCGTDLLCYRAGFPDALAARQAAGWDGMLDWAAETLGARLVITVGVMPVDQDPVALETLRAGIEAFDPFALAAFHDLVTLSGSAILAFAVVRGRLGPDQAWDLATIDEIYQAEQWGDDDEATQKAARRRAAFLDAARFFRAL